MAKLCAKGKAAAKRKFKVYPSAYANMYASGVCSGKITPGGKRQKKNIGGPVIKEPVETRIMRTKTKAGENAKRLYNQKMKQYEKLKSKQESQKNTRPKRTKMMGGGMMTQPRAMYGKGGGVCIRGMNRDAIGKNS